MAGDSAIRQQLFPWFPSDGSPFPLGYHTLQHSGMAFFTQGNSPLPPPRPLLHTIHLNSFPVLPSEQEIKTATLLGLPHKVQREIALQLDTHDILHFRLTCKALRAASHHAFVLAWVEEEFQIYMSKDSLCHRESPILYHPGDRYLGLTSFYFIPPPPPMSDDKLLHVVSPAILYGLSGLSLSELQLSHCDIYGPSLLRLLKVNKDSLKSIKFNLCSITIRQDAADPFWVNRRGEECTFWGNLIHFLLELPQLKRVEFFEVYYRAWLLINTTMYRYEHVCVAEIGCGCNIVIEGHDFTQKLLATAVYTKQDDDILIKNWNDPKSWDDVDDPEYKATMQLG